MSCFRKHVTFHLAVTKDGGSMVLRKVGILPQNYTKLQARGLWLKKKTYNGFLQ